MSEPLLAVERLAVSFPSEVGRMHVVDRVGLSISAGETRYYFTIYRDPQAATPCANSSSTVNLSNAVAVIWAP